MDGVIIKYRKPGAAHWIYEKVAADKLNERVAILKELGYEVENF